MTIFEKDFEHNQELLQAALAEFNKKGYSKASLSNILKKAKMSKGAFYYHFKNKEDLYFGLIETLINKKKTFLAKNLKPELIQQDIFTILKHQMHLSIEFARNNPEIGEFSERFLQEKGTPIYQKALKKYNLINNDAFQPIINASYQRGFFRQDLTLEFISNVIGFFFTHTADLTQITKTDDYEENVNNLIELLKSGVETRGR